MRSHSLHTSRVTGTGSAFPRKRVTNDELAKRVETSDQWVRERTGIVERRISEPGNADEFNSSMALVAARRALDMAGRQPEDIDQIIFATVSPDTPLPATACWLQARLGAKNAWCFDLNAACTGFLYGLTLADQCIRTGLVKTSLVIGSEVLSRMVNWDDRNTCVLFGDGSGAWIVERAPEGYAGGILSSHLGARGDLAHLIAVPGGGTREPISPEVLSNRLNTIHLQGREVYKEAVTVLTDYARKALEAAHVTKDDVAWFVPHQANLRIIEAVADRLGFPMERVLLNIDRFGNTSSASIPTVLDEAVRDGRVKAGDLLLFDAFGAGITNGSLLIRW
jgi:3-oxoacyl-[acyl-carrier-protein] synthase-3